MTVEAEKARAARWFEELRDRLTGALEAVEDEHAARRGQGTAGRFERRAWSREGGGGGVMAILKGQVFEKAGVNVSTVHGEFSPELRAQIPGAGRPGQGPTTPSTFPGQNPGPGANGSNTPSGTRAPENFPSKIDDRQFARDAAIASLRR